MTLLHTLHNAENNCIMQAERQRSIHYLHNADFSALYRMDTKVIDGQKLAEWRNGMKLSQMEVAVMLGVSDSAVNRWEKGQQIPAPCQKLLGLLLYGVPPFGSPDDPRSDQNFAKYVMPTKLTFEEWGKIETLAREGGFRNPCEYVQDWLRRQAKAARDSRKED